MRTAATPSQSLKPPAKACGFAPAFNKMGRIHIKHAKESGAEAVSSILWEAANWLVRRGTPLWNTDVWRVRTCGVPETQRKKVGPYWVARYDCELK